MMKVQKHTGLVAIKLLKPVDNYRRNRVHGFPPDKAREVLKGGYGEKADVPNVVDYTEVWDGLSDDPSKKAVDKRAGAPPEPPAAGGNPDPGSVAIPDDWQTRHHMANIATAKQITGEANAKVSGREAEEIIQGELDRRAANA